MIMYIQVLAGLVILVGAAEILVRGAVSLANQFGISPLVIGMTVVAVGTSAPELVVSLDALYQDAPALAVGNIVGSNIANVLLILGATCFFKPIIDHPGTTPMDGWILTGGSALFVGICIYGEIGFVGGILLLIVFFCFLGGSYWRHSYDPEAIEDAEHEVEDLQGAPRPVYASVILVVLGLVGLGLGADILVEGGVQVARAFGVSEEVIGLTLFALGTSLPELAASLVAAFRGHPAVAIGNVIGSNMFNILGIGGVIGLLGTIQVPAQIIEFDVWIMFAATAVLFPVLVWNWRVTRSTGVMLLVAYLGYVGVQAYGVKNAMALLG